MSAKEINNAENIILGSGDLYLMKFTGTVPEDATIETEDNQAGNIKGGATLEYKAESTSVEDDKGRVKKTVTTSEEVTFKTGLITWVKEYIQALVATARVDESSKPGHRVFKIGGLGNAAKDRWLWRFVHTRDDGRKLRVTVTGKNTGTISLAFDPAKESTVDAEIKADTLDDNGTLVIIDDQITASPEAAAANMAEDQGAGGK